MAKPDKRLSITLSLQPKDWQLLTSIVKSGVVKSPTIHKAKAFGRIRYNMMRASSRLLNQELTNL